MYLVGLDKEGMALDLGGIAKGYIAGRMASRMRRAGAIAGLVAAAGDVYAFGERPENLVRKGGDRRWGVAVQDPRYPEDRTRLFTAVHVRDQAVDTSGHYYRGYTIEGRRFSHIVDPRTGRPVDTRLASVTVLAPDAATADGLATGIAVLGVEKGMELVEKTAGVECLLLELGEEPAEGSAEKPPLVAHRSSGFAALEFDPSATGGREAALLGDSLGACRRPP
jgi:thiamine biosynthesis lipoprotein